MEDAFHKSLNKMQEEYGPIFQALCSPYSHSQFFFNLATLCRWIWAYHASWW